MKSLRFVFPTLLLVGCATTAVPYGEFDGFNNRNAADLDLADVVVMSVDGKLPFASDQGVVSLTPGVHMLTLGSSRDTVPRSSRDAVLHPQGTVHGSPLFIETLIKVEACRRYTFRAKHDSRLPDRPWELVPTGEVAVPGCKAPSPAAATGGTATASPPPGPAPHH